jgi:hypothetical protein
VDRELNRSELQVMTNAELKDHMRERDMGKLADTWYSIVAHYHATGALRCRFFAPFSTLTFRP